jgi:hypothetical protein
VISHQIYGDDRFHAIIRAKCMDYMESDAGFFSQFVEGGLATFPRYLEAKRSNSCWGDDPEIQAYVYTRQFIASGNIYSNLLCFFHRLSEIYQRPIEIWAYDSTLGTYFMKL